MRAFPAFACIVTLLAGAGCAPQPAPPAAASSSDADHIRAVSFTDVRLQDAFWRPRFERNREVTIPHIMEQNELTGRVDNFRKGAGLMEGPYEGRRFNDTDIYKVVEAASYAIAQQPDAMGLSSRDRVLPIVPLFHANGWGLAFSCPMAGAAMIMPGARMDGASVYEILTTEKVTFSAAVPTVWLMLLQYLEQNDRQTDSVPHI